ncbi:MAG: SPOR domain-containing protein [Betaproteobacteria bacterium]|nr:SPOR domain-containing protein [Betaproteobacteria bacterium]
MGAFQRGSIALGMMLGIVIGLAVAVAVAVFVTRAPLPFVNKVVRSGDRIVEPRTPAEAPDPNRPSAARQRPADAPAPAARSAGETPPAGTPAPAASPDRAPAASVGAAPAGDGAEAATERMLYVLQAGAFRLADDADNMKAKLALIGLEARVQPAEVNGQRVFRVRIGPYVNLDDLNRARARLEENGIESSVVRQR